MLTTRSSQKFTTARKRAILEEWLNYFKGRSNALLPFEEVKQNLRLLDSAYKGLQEIELAKIVGSAGRYRDFSRTFLPKTDNTEQRWRQLQTVSEGVGFPPIEVYQVGEVYFVKDGNHRVSVARASGLKFIEAYVVEYKSPVPVEQEDDLAALILKAERAAFFEATKLAEIRPDQQIVFTEPGRYPQVREHIMFHKYLKEREFNREIPYQEALVSWYDHVYMPLVELIRQREVLKQLPGRTEADLYLWLVKHRAELESEAQVLSHIPDEKILDDFTDDKANLLTRLGRFLRQRLQRQNLPLEMERADFFANTQLDVLRPAQTIEFTELGSYQLVKEHIGFHKYLKEVELQEPLSYQAAVASWYDQVYEPLVRLIREKNLLDQFSKRTEADLYLWLVQHRASLEEKMRRLGQIPDEILLEDLKAQATPTIISWLSRLFQDQPLPSHTRLLKLEQQTFFKETELDHHRPESAITFSQLGGYRLLQEHIAFHKYLRETASQQEISYPQAATSWYDRVYQPLIELMRHHELGKHFPEYTEADLYICVVLRRAAREDELDGLGRIADEEVIRELKKTDTPTSWLSSMVPQL